MGYVWQPRECDPVTGIPYSKLRAARLEKGEMNRKFKNQKELDWAWANGWHEPGRPETADDPNEIVEKKEPQFKRDEWPPRDQLVGMNMTELQAFVAEKDIPGVDGRWGYYKLRSYVVKFVREVTKGEK